MARSTKIDAPLAAPVGAQTRSEASAARGRRVVSLLRADTAQLQRTIDRYSGPDPEVLRAYRRRFFAELASLPPQSLRRDECLRRAATADVVFCGDDHSAVGAKIVCRDLLAAMLADPSRPVVLVVELADRAQQAELDAFAQGELTLAQLEAKVFARGALSGFGFEGYGALLELARSRGVRIVGADSKGELHERDGVAAHVVAQALTHDPKARVLVQYGHLHLASDHLPAAVRERLTAAGVAKQVARVFTAHDASYFRMLRVGTGAQAVAFDASTFCVFGAKPRAARKAYLRYLYGE